MKTQKIIISYNFLVVTLKRFLLALFITVISITNIGYAAITVVNFGCKYSPSSYLYIKTVPNLISNSHCMEVYGGWKITNIAVEVIAGIFSDGTYIPEEFMMKKKISSLKMESYIKYLKWEIGTIDNCSYEIGVYDGQGVCSNVPSGSQVYFADADGVCGCIFTSF